MEKFKKYQKVVVTEGVHAIAIVLCSLPFKKTCYPFGDDEKTQTYLVWKVENLSSKYPIILCPITIVAEKGLQDLKEYLDWEKAFIERSKKYIGQKGYSLDAANKIIASTEKLKSHLS